MIDFKRFMPDKGGDERISADQWAIRVDQAFTIQVRYPGDKRWYEYARRHLPGIPFEAHYREWSEVQITPHSRYPARIWFEALNFSDNKYGISQVRVGGMSNMGTKENAAFDFICDESATITFLFDPYKPRTTEDLDLGAFVAPGPPFYPTAAPTLERTLIIDRSPKKLMIEAFGTNLSAIFYRINSESALDYRQLDSGDVVEYIDCQIDRIDISNRSAVNSARVVIDGW